MDERRKKAFDFAQETSKQLLTLATAVIGLTVTFGKDFIGNVSGFPRTLVVACWVLMLVSILCGLCTLMALTGTLEPQNPEQAAGEPSINGSNVKLPAIAQVLTFLFALVAAVTFGLVARPGSDPAPNSPAAAKTAP